MKILKILLLLPVIALSQQGVGINTDTPSKTLDVAGDMHIRKTPHGNSESDFILSIDNNGNINKINVSELSSIVPEFETAMFVPYKAGSNVLNSKKATLDLWTEQETNGIESIKRYYFLGNQHRVTLPKNITKKGDNKVRKISFITIKNNELTSTDLGNSWDLYLQTKLYEEQLDVFNGGNAGVCLYKSIESSTRLFGTGDDDGFKTQGNVGCFRRRVKINSEGRLADREVTLYDFGGKWFLPIND